MLQSIGHWYIELSGKTEMYFSKRSIYHIFGEGRNLASNMTIIISNDHYLSPHKCTHPLKMYFLWTEKIKKCFQTFCDSNKCCVFLFSHFSCLSLTKLKKVFFGFALCNLNCQNANNEQYTRSALPYWHVLLTKHILAYENFFKLYLLEKKFNNF